MAARHARRMARIVALAVLGSNILKPTPGKGGAVHYEEDRRALDDLTNLFFHTIKPSELFRLTMTINAMCNLGDFIHSIRLMSAARTTVPTRIEADSAD